MYCVKCGVELADSEKKCPLCGTPVFHPDIPRNLSEPPFPPDKRIRPEDVNRSGVLFVLTIAALLPALLCLLCDWRINGTLVWSGYAAGAIALLYVVILLPMWFRRPNPVIFVPVDFIAVGLYLLYINFATGGHWFLSFAFPVTGAIGLLISAAVALTHYLRGGYLYIYGGMLILGGGLRRAHRVPDQSDVPDPRDALLVILSDGRGHCARPDADRHRHLQAPARIPAPEILPVRQQENKNRFLHSEKHAWTRLGSCVFT